MAISFDRVASEYEATRILPAEVATAAARLLLTDVTPNRWVLEAGAGTGRLGRALATRHEQTVGIDIAAAMLARARPEMAHLALADVTALPFPDGVFARVLSVHVIHLVADWQRALTEMARVLAPSGRLYLGFEEHRQPKIRAHYLKRARERGLLLLSPGAHVENCQQALPGLGLRGRTLLWEALQWSYPITVAQQLEQLRQRSFSVLWDVPEESHQELLAETEAFADTTTPDREFSEKIEARLWFLEVRKT